FWMKSWDQKYNYRGGHRLRKKRSCIPIQMGEDDFYNLSGGNVDCEYCKELKKRFYRPELEVEKAGA
ncbi:hypothetical protein COCHEDRAFT_1023544, partial [Bipolaris maydis C5]